jgi:hypothetical protein
MPRRLNARGYFLARDLRLETEMEMQQSISGISAPVSQIGSSSPLI